MKIKKILAIFIILGIIGTTVPEAVCLFSVVASAQGSSGLSAPQNINASANENSVTLTWDDVEGAEVYKIYMYDTENKKYNSIKTVKGTTATIKGLEVGIKYKFRIRAAVKSGNSYKTGVVSDTVSITLKKLSVVSKDISTKKMIGEWKFYDFVKMKYTDGTEYNPEEKQEGFEPYLYCIYVLTSQKAALLFDSEKGKETAYYSLTDKEFEHIKYKIYSFGKSKYLFLDWSNSGESYSYIFEYKGKVEKKAITDISEYEGTWTCIDCCSSDISSDVYDPKYRMYRGKLNFTNAEVKDGKISINTKYDNVYLGGDLEIKENTIAEAKYYVYEIRGEYYLFFKFKNGKNINVYVFKKD